jgi:hypothetical protein
MKPNNLLAEPETMPLSPENHLAHQQFVSCFKWKEIKERLIAWGKHYYQELQIEQKRQTLFSGKKVDELQAKMDGVKDLLGMDDTTFLPLVAKQH